MSEKNEESLGLSEDSTLKELFDAIPTHGGVGVFPMTVKDDEGDTRLLMAVSGEQTTAAVIFAALWETIENLSDIAQQREAASKDDDEKPRIITS